MRGSNGFRAVIGSGIQVAVFTDDQELRRFQDGVWVHGAIHAGLRSYAAAPGDKGKMQAAQDGCIIETRPME